MLSEKTSSFLASWLSSSFAIIALNWANAKFNKYQVAARKKHTQIKKYVSMSNKGLPDIFLIHSGLNKYTSTKKQGTNAPIEIEADLIPIGIFPYSSRNIMPPKVSNQSFRAISNFNYSMK